jgi:hypothetical protein
LYNTTWEALPDSERYVSAYRLPIFPGMVPLKPLFRIKNSLNEVRFDIEFGMVPVNKLFSKCK